ncbi:GNAT family N-acetyltransferase [Ferrimonas balearica]|uniref:GNAT family N-acetyltransferase n=1 Tax=Ferrimonas balearica TaxID=44012 RepID=UPI002D7F0BBF|nr:GNAT family N-acetyltransferase [Ferrimonas balearica]MBY6094859.1 GNAT family N-acetyltransferase [Ferrimonas balearica]
MSLQLRTLAPADDAGLAAIIRQVLTEYGANRSGFAWADPELDRLSQVYSHPNHHYLVALWQGELVGGAGFAPFPCEHDRVCELQKMYLLPEARGKGIGGALLDALISSAAASGYRHCYLETFGPMSEAQGLYRSRGFEPLSAPWGESGHNACDHWYARRLELAR